MSQLNDNSNWHPQKSLHIERDAHTATLMPDGSILVVGGYGNESPPEKEDTPSSLKSAEYLPVGETEWVKIEPGLTVARSHHTATLLDDGTVLIVGGWHADDIAENEFLRSIELFTLNPDDIKKSKFIEIGKLEVGRHDHTTSLAKNNIELFITGGAGKDGNLSSMERIDLNASEIKGKVEAFMDHGRSFHQAITFENHIVVIGGLGENDVTLTSSEYFNMSLWPITGRWSDAGNLQDSRCEFSITRLSDYEIMVTGGKKVIKNAEGELEETVLNTAEIFSVLNYDWDKCTWSLLDTKLTKKRHNHGCMAFDVNRVLIFGGENKDEYLDQSEWLIHDPAEKKWKNKTEDPMTAPRCVFSTNGVYNIDGFSLKTGNKDEKVKGVLVTGGYQGGTLLIGGVELFIDPDS